MKRQNILFFYLPLAVLLAIIFYFYSTGALKAITLPKADDHLFLKLFIVAEVTIAAALIILWRRRRSEIQRAEKSHLKKNIMKLREEKVLVPRDKNLGMLRKKLQASSKITKLNKAAKARQAKKLSISTGEIELAARLKSLDKNNQK